MTKQHLYIDIEELLEDLRIYWVDNPEHKYNPTALTKLKRTGSHLMFCCPHHSETNPSCGMMLDYPYGWNCFGCGTSGNLEQFIAKAVGLPSELHAYQWMLRNYSVHSVKDRPPIDIKRLLDGDGVDRKRSLPEEEVGRHQVAQHPYMSKRGFNQRTLQKYEVGYDPATRAVTFPVRASDGSVRFIKRRFVDHKGFLNERDVYKKDIVYGLYYLTQAPKPITEIFLTESETDTMSCYQVGLPAGAVLGRMLFAEQLRALQLAGIKVVNLFFDNDGHGANGTRQAYKLLTKTPIRVNVVTYPTTERETYKDANDLLRASKLRDIKVVPYEQYITLIKQ